MRWAMGMLAGPTLWAVLFVVVYALHGIGCAWGWPSVSFGPTSLQIAAMMGAWFAGLVLHLVLLWQMPKGHDREARLQRAGAWIGLVASGVTLLPIVVTSSCG